ncbi:MAG TPA: GTP cyclohydrolase II RibA [Xanthobacteraceae bacterium]|jgi:GTP cyclohydrolase II
MSGNGKAGLFGASRQVAVERCLAEFRSGRPCIITSTGEAALALPVDGMRDAALASFRSLCRCCHLLVTARRARALGIEAAGPVGIAIGELHGAAAIYSWAADVGVSRKLSVVPAGAAAPAAIELAKLAQRLPALLIGAPRPEAVASCDPPLLSVDAAAVGQFRQAALALLSITGEASIPLNDGLSARFVVFRDAVGGTATAVVVGKPDLAQPVPVRLHSACLTGDVFGSRRCDCGDQLRLALIQLAQGGGGIILYLEQEGRGLGLANKIRTYALQDCGLDTVDANTVLGFEDDERDYGVAVRMLQALGCTRVRLLTNNPTKLEGLSRAGIDVSGRVPLHGTINSDNRRYLTAKARRAGHQLDHLLGALAEPDDGPRQA